jgi:hypothetical protein
VKGLTRLGVCLGQVDEAQSLKNDKGKFHHTVRGLNTNRIILLTGTPLQVTRTCS